MTGVLTGDLEVPKGREVKDSSATHGPQDPYPCYGDTFLDSRSYTSTISTATGTPPRVVYDFRGVRRGLRPAMGGRSRDLPSRRWPLWPAPTWSSRTPEPRSYLVRVGRSPRRGLGGDSEGVLDSDRVSVVRTSTDSGVVSDTLFGGLERGTPVPSNLLLLLLRSPDFLVDHGEPLVRFLCLLSSLDVQLPENRLLPCHGVTRDPCSFYGRWFFGNR